MAKGTRSGLPESALRQPRLSHSEERELLARARSGDAAAVTRLITSHLRFVLHIARRYRNYGHPLADLFQEGTVGLMEAFKRFNPERDVRLATYAMWWIRSSIQDYVVRSRSLVRIGTTAAQKSVFFNLRRRVGELIDGDVVSEDFARSLAERFNMSVAEVVNLARRIARPDQSLDEPASPDGGQMLIDQVADQGPTPEDSVAAAGETRLWRTVLAAALAKLPPRELLIIRQRFLAEFKTSRAALGAELGLSKERVRQLEVRALARLRELMHTALDQPGAAPSKG